MPSGLAYSPFAPPKLTHEVGSATAGRPARAYSTCEMLSFWDVDGWQLLARLGLVADRTDDDDDDDEANACLFTKCCLADVREAAGHARS